MIRKALCVFATALALSQSAVAETRPDLAQSAKSAFSAGRIEMARMLALAALRDDPWNPTALAVLAGVGLATGEPKAARVVAAQSFRATENPQDKFIAARLAARASVDAGQNGIAKYWLRRAVQVAPSEEARAATVRDFAQVRARSRMRVDLQLSVKPSDNVNQGSRDTMLVIDGQPTWFYFDGTARALSGVEAATTVAARYRLGGTVTEPTELGLRLYHRAVGLSGEAKALAPAAQGSDFANSAVDLSLSHIRRLSDTREVKLEWSLGRTWLAGDPYADRARLEAGLTSLHGTQAKSRLGLAVERQWLASGRPSATAISLDAGIAYQLTTGDTLSFRVEAGETQSADANQDQRRLGASLRYALAAPVAGAKISASLAVTARDYPVFFNGVFNDTGRQDLTTAGSLDVALPKLGAFGFEPVLSLETSRTRSNVSRYDGQTVGIGLRIQSSF